MNNKNDCRTFRFCSFIGLSLLLSSCAILTSDRDEVKLKESYLKSTEQYKISNEPGVAEHSIDENQKGGKLTVLNSLQYSDQLRGQTQDLAKKFTNDNEIQLAVDELPLKEFLHYALGDLLKVSYLLDEQTKKDSQPVTLSIKDKISNRRLFILMEDVLQRRGYVVSLKNNIYYVVASQKKRGKTNNVFGIGANPKDVPNTSRNIVQIVPLKYGLKSSLNVLLAQVVDVIATPDIEQGAMFLRGKQENIIKALEFIALIDRPSASSQHIGVIELIYSSPDEFITQAMTLMKNEGISVSKDTPSGNSIVFIPLVNTGSIAIFAKSEEFLRRVEFWGRIIDKPQKGSDKRYFVYHPKFARAVDLGESLKPLLGESVTVSAQKTNTSKSSASSTRRGNDNGARKSRQSGRNDISLVVDERSNVLVFYSSGGEYQNILPLVKRLDVMPKQVLLDVMIAEVTLKDEFKKGVEFLLKEATNSGVNTTSTDGAFGVGGGLTYSWIGSDKSINVSLFQDNSLVNVISQPTILVRDGVEASISVGTDIPVVGATTIDPIGGQRQTTTVEYRKTGVELKVSPTVNAQGVLIMNIDLKISNTVDSGVTTAGSPSIFERSIKTEVVAGSGQSIILGGLISENKTKGTTKVPILGDIPIIGHLFRGDSTSTDKTELIVMVTPKVIQRQDEWSRLKQSFNKKLRNLSIENVN